MRYIQKITGGTGGIRTPGTIFTPYNGLANRRFQPLSHRSKKVFKRRTLKTQHLDQLADFDCNIESLFFKQKKASSGQ
jgi:hypothetical protein